MLKSGYSSTSSLLTHHTLYFCPQPDFMRVIGLTPHKLVVRLLLLSLSNIGYLFLVLGSQVWLHLFYLFVYSILPFKEKYHIKDGLLRLRYYFYPVVLNCWCYQCYVRTFSVVTDDFSSSYTTFYSINVSGFNKGRLGITTFSYFVVKTLPFRIVCGGIGPLFVIVVVTLQFTKFYCVTLATSPSKYYKTYLYILFLNYYFFVFCLSIIPCKKFYWSHVRRFIRIKNFLVTKTNKTGKGYHLV